MRAPEAAYLAAHGDEMRAELAAAGTRQETEER